MITVDAVRLRVMVGDKVYEISEEQEGFTEFLHEAERHYRFPVGWWDQVANPPFQRNEIRLFYRC